MWQKNDTSLGVKYQSFVVFPANGATIRKSHCVMSCFTCSAVGAFAIGCRYRSYVDETDMLSLTTI